jgi:cold shock protein
MKSRSAPTTKDRQMGKHTDARLTGTVKNIVAARGFGFIREDDSNLEYFFHYTSAVGVAFDHIQPGIRVSFTAGRGPKGPRAEHVELL